LDQAVPTAEYLHVPYVVPIERAPIVHFVITLTAYESLLAELNVADALDWSRAVINGSHIRAAATHAMLLSVSIRAGTRAVTPQQGHSVIRGYCLVLLVRAGPLHLIAFAYP